MSKGISTITSEIILTIISLLLITPIIASIGLFNGININDNEVNILSCIQYRFLNNTLIAVFNSCDIHVIVYPSLSTNNFTILYYNDTSRTTKATNIIYSHKLHFIKLNAPARKILLNTSLGFLILENN